MALWLSPNNALLFIALLANIVPYRVSATSRTETQSFATEGVPAYAPGTVETLTALNFHETLTRFSASEQVQDRTVKESSELLETELTPDLPNGRSRNLVLVKFYSKWCKQCVASNQDFLDAASDLAGRLHFAQVDCTLCRQLCQTLSIGNTYPVLRLYRNGNFFSDYPGPRDRDSIVSFGHRSLRSTPYDVVRTSAEFKNFWLEHTEFVGPTFAAGQIADGQQGEQGFDTSSHESNHDGSTTGGLIKGGVVVGVDLDQSTALAFSRAALTTQYLIPAKFAFVEASSPDIISPVLNLASGQIALVKVESSRRHVIIFNANQFDNVEDFLRANVLTVFGEFIPDQADLYESLNQPIVFGFSADGNTSRERHLNLLRDVAVEKQGNGKIGFLWVNKQKYPEFAEHLHIDDQTFPICAYSFDKDQIYPIPPDVRRLSVPKIMKWVEELVSSELPGVSRSSAPPAKQNTTGPHQLVSITWPQVVDDAETDVLVAQIIPWCEKCKRLMPIYSKVADELRDAGIDSVVIAVMDASENDPPMRKNLPKNFPLITFFPGSNKAGIVYDGELFTKDLIEFIMFESTYPFNFNTSKLGPDPVLSDKDLVSGPTGPEGERVDHVHGFSNRMKYRAKSSVADQVPGNAAESLSGRDEL